MQDPKFWNYDKNTTQNRLFLIAMGHQLFTKDRITVPICNIPGIALRM